METSRETVERIGKTMNVKSPLDWAKVTTKSFKKLGGNTLLLKHGSIKNILMFVFPGN
jgi:hypothetical protein